MTTDYEYEKSASDHAVAAAIARNDARHDRARIAALTGDSFEDATARFELHRHARFQSRVVTCLAVVAVALITVTLATAIKPTAAKPSAISTAKVGP